MSTLNLTCHMHRLHLLGNVCFGFELLQLLYRSFDLALFAMQAIP